MNNRIRASSIGAFVLLGFSGCIEQQPASPRPAAYQPVYYQPVYVQPVYMPPQGGIDTRSGADLWLRGMEAGHNR